MKKNTNSSSVLAYIGMCVLFSLLAGCVAPTPVATPTPPLPDEIVLYDWVNDIPEKAIEAFTTEFNIQVRYETYESQKEAIDNITANGGYDVVVMDNRFVPALIKAGQLAELNHANLPNLDNYPADFRDRQIDRGNHYSVPYTWGTTGLVVRSDKVTAPVTSWNDLWKQDSTGKVVMWKGVPREMIGPTLKSLGYSVNSENPQELEQALAKLETLRPNLIFGEDYGPDLDSSGPILSVGDAVVAVGWATDAIQGQMDNQDIIYVFPTEGALMWGDNFVVPANSANQYAAELLINFLLRPEISALVTNSNGYPTGNEKANRYISADVLNNTFIFPPSEVTRKAETILPLSPEGEALYQSLWDRFLGENQ